MKCVALISSVIISLYSTAVCATDAGRAQRESDAYCDKEIVVARRGSQLWLFMMLTTFMFGL